MEDQKQGLTDKIKQWMEKRKAPRVEFRSEISLESEDNLYAGLTQDISNGGIFVNTDRLLPIGTQLWIEFAIPTSEKKLKVRVIVRWLRARNSKSDTEPGMGLQFLELTEEAQEALGSFIELREPMLYER